MVSGWNRWIVPVLCGLGLAWGLATPAAAQIFATPSNLSLPVDPELSTALFIAQQAIAGQEWDRAVEVLQTILDADEDSFLSPDDPRSLQRHAEELLAKLPVEGRQLYVRQFGPAAEALLESARRTQDQSRYSELVRRFFLTPAGGEGAWRQACLRQDQGAALAAALLFEKLLGEPAAGSRYGQELEFRAAAAWLAAGNESRAGQRLAAWRSQSTTPLTIQGQPLTPPRDPSQSLEWLRTLLGTSRVVVAGRPLAERESDPPRLPPFSPPNAAADWEALPLCTDSILAGYPDRAAELSRVLMRLEADQFAQAADSGRVLVPAASPLVLGETVLYRGPDRLSALSAVDGSLLWTGTPVDFTYRELAEKAEFSTRDEMTRELYLGQRGWRDETSAAMSSDGTLVYTVMDCGMIGVVDPGNPFQAGGRHGKGAFRDNSLQAYSLRGGKQRWSIGGPITPQDEPFGGMYFLGPPLPHEGVLYCLVEDRGQVRLLALRSRVEGEPELLWSQSLLNPSPWMDIENHEGRRTAALQPVARGNVLICPTGAGSVVAVDLFERRLLWGRSYQDEAPSTRRPFRRPPRVQLSLVERQKQALDRLLDAERWRDHSAVWVGDYVLVPTPDADTLTCLRASEGKELWTVARDNWLYIAGCALDHVVLVGANQIGALWLADGEPAWPSETPIPTPCGRGIEHDGLYTLPVVTGELITIDLRTGQLLARSPVAGDEPLGNLAAAGGRLLSQSASGVRGFAAQIDSQPWLAAIEQPDSADADLLTSAGESLLHAGQFTRGTAALRKAIEKSDATRARQVLAAVLTERLRTDFPQHRGDADEIERLVKGTATELAFHRLMASASQRTGDTLRTFRHLLRMTRLVDAEQPLEVIEEGYSVSLDRWIAGQLSALSATASDEDRATIHAQWRDELRGTETAPVEFETLSRLSPLLRGTSLQSEGELALARLCPANLDPALRLQAWLDVLDQPDDEHHAEATARLAELCLECHDPALAAVYVESLRTDYADQPTVAGRTGAEWLALWEQDPRLGEVLSQVRSTQWPAGELDLRATGADVATPQFHPIPVRGAVSGPLTGWTFAYHDQKQQISAHTPRGEFVWETPAGVDSGRQQSIPQEIMIQGPLVMVFWPDRLQILSAITKEGGRFRPIRLTRSHQSNLADFNPIFQQRGGMERAGTTGPLTRELVCYHQGTALIGLDPWTGRDVWRRNQFGVRELLGDDDYVVVQSARQDDLQVLRASDGAVVASRPPPDDHLSPPDGADWGRGFMTITSHDDAADLLARFDPVTGEPAWKRELKSPVYWTTIDGGQLLVIDGDWTCRLIDPDTGDELAHAAMPGEPPTERLLLPMTAIADSRHIYFVLNEPVDLARRQVQPQNVSGRMVNGLLCAWSKSTREIVWSQQVDGLFLNPRQPPAWPVLVLTARQKSPEDSAEVSVQAAYDKQTGKLLLEDRQPREGLRNDIGRRMSWRVQGDGPTIRINHDLRSLVIQPKPTTEQPTEEQPPRESTE